MRKVRARRDDVDMTYTYKTTNEKVVVICWYHVSVVARVKSSLKRSSWNMSLIVVSNETPSFLVALTQLDTQ